MLMAQFAPSYPAELFLIPFCGFWGVATFVGFWFLVRRWPSMAWAGVMVGSLCFVGGILLERAILIWGKSVQPWQLRIWPLVTMLPGLALLAMGWHYCRFPPNSTADNARPLSPAKRFFLSLSLW